MRVMVGWGGGVGGGGEGGRKHIKFERKDNNGTHPAFSQDIPIKLKL